LFAIVEAVHALSFLLRCINADMLHFDANSRYSKKEEERRLQSSLPG